MFLSKALVAGLAASQVANALAPCGYVSQLLSSSTGGSFQTTASVAYDCLTSVPFVQADALGFLAKYRATLQFYSIPAWLKDPPSSYQQPATDIFGGLDQIEAKVNSSSYTNQYDFEADLQALLQSSHDGHLYLNIGATNVFYFSLPFKLTSVSVDGVSLPQPYSYDDLLAASASGSSWSPSALQTINGQDAITWLTSFAAQYSAGLLEPHADWNNLFPIDAGATSGFPYATAYNSRYVGDWFNVTFANGTHYPGRMLASLLGVIPWDVNINSGEDFYKVFVAEPSTATASAAVSTSAPTTVATTPAAAANTPQAQPKNWAQAKPNVLAYPSNPAVVQADLGNGNSYLTGYFFPEQSLAVLSVPSFQMTGIGAQSFSATVNTFITQAKANGLQRIILDVQSNGGGDKLLSTELFKNFFPTIYPFSGSRMRAHDAANILGTDYTSAFLNSSVPDSLKSLFIAEPWTAPIYIDAATGQQYSSWGELSQNYSQKGDLFTITLQENLTIAAYDLTSTSGANQQPGIVIDGFANRTNEGPQPYDAYNIVVLLDAQCASTCTTFADMFKHDGGVRTIVVGGRPQYGPMQARSGVRGAQSYELDALTRDLANLIQYGPPEAVAQIQASFPSERNYYRVPAVSFNLRDQIRANESFPLQFAYEPADCRIFYTPETVSNFANLWLYVANVAWGNGTCVQGSKGVASSYGNGTGVAGSNGTSLNGSSPTGGSPPSPTASTPVVIGAASKVGGVGLAMFLAAGLAALI